MSMAVIKDKMFGVSCPAWREDCGEILDKLAIRRDEDPFRALERNGWDGQSGVVSMVTTINAETKLVAATRYITAGKLMEYEGRPTSIGGYAEVPAKNGAGLRLNFTVRGEMIKWPENELHRNVTSWFPLANLDTGMEWRDKEGILSKARLAEKYKLDADSFAARMTLRFTLQHSKELGAMRLSCSALFRQADLMPDWLADSRPTVVPGIALKPKGGNGVWTDVAWAPLEGECSPALQH